MRTYSTLWFLALALVAPSALASSPPVTALAAVPSAVFAKEGTAVLFQAKVPSAATHPARVALVQIDAQGNKIQYLGVMKPERKDPSVFSRKVELNGKKGGKLTFVAVDESAGEASKETLLSLPKAEVEIVARPTLPEILGQIWKKIAS